MAGPTISLPSLVAHARPLVLGSGDVLVHAPGFEDRSLAVLEMVVGRNSARALLLDYRPKSPSNKMRHVRGQLLERGLSVSREDVLVYDRFDPSDFEARLSSRLEVLEAKRVVVDVSTMSKLAILLVLEVCRKLGSYTLVLYAEARTYRPTRTEFEEARERGEIHRPTLQVFSGVHGVVRASSLASVAMQGQPTAAIAFMSFNDALTQVLLNTVYPSRLFLVNGRPPSHDWREAATAWIHEQVRHEWEHDNPLGSRSFEGVFLPARVASTLDYRESVRLVLSLYWQLSASHRVLLAPSGSKMQAIGCFLLKALHPDIHIEYPSPEGFAREYSTGIAERWLLELGHISGLVDSIGAAERQIHLKVQG